MTAQTILPANSVVDTGFATNSCRFNRVDEAAMSKSSLSGGSTTKGTVSVWLKRSGIGTDQRYWANYGGSASDRLQFGWQSANKLYIQHGDSVQFITTRVFQDVSAWYHIVIAVDSTESDNANRVKVYVNGVRETAFDTFNTLTEDGEIFMNNDKIIIGERHTSDLFYDGYLCEVVQLDGTAAAPTAFGEFDSDSGIWVPIDVSGLTFGNNGYYLNFKNASNLGNDANGGTDFTESNLAATDQGLDTCTNNFATLNSIVKSAATLSEGNLKQAGAGKSSVATIGVTSGKWYFEQKFIGSGVNEATLGFALEGSGIFTNDVGGNTVRGTGYVTLYVYDGKIYNEGTATSSFATFAVNDIIGWNLDADAGDIFLYRNGSILNSGSAVVSGKTGKTWFPFGNFDTGDVTGVEHNFGGARTFSISSAVTDGKGFGAFEFAPKSGHLAICTKNLAENG